ncbi:MAG: phosphatase PAP2 family protein [Solimonas sp.]
MLLHRITEFGNSAVLFLLGLLLALWLYQRSGRRAALAWSLALLACTGTIAALKLYFLGCPLPHLGLRSPSGHAGFSTFVYGGVTLCVAQDPQPWRRRLLSLVGCAWIAVIAWSRYAVHAHTPIEILCGLAIGCVFLLLFVRSAGTLPHQRFPFAAAVLLIFACTLAFYLLDWRLNFEHWLRLLGRHYVRDTGLCWTGVQGNAS